VSNDGNDHKNKQKLSVDLSQGSLKQYRSMYEILIDVTGSQISNQLRSN